MAGVVQFYYGSDAQKYLSEFKTGKYADALFFDTKQKVIYRNGDIYGGTGDNQGVLPEQIEGLIASVEPDDKNGLGPDYAYIYSFINQSGNAVDSIEIPVASSTNSGLMTPEEKNKLSGINLSNYVVKEAGKGLSSNDFTQTYIDKIAALEDLAEPNVIESIKVDNTALPIAEDKSVNIDLSNLINARVSSTYVYKGTEKKYSDLPSTNNSAGDVWNVEEAYDMYPAGTNFAWVETKEGGYWDALSGVFDTTSLENRIGEVDGKISGVSSRVSNLEAIDADTRLDTIEGFLGNMENVTLEKVVGDISLTNIEDALKWVEIK